MATGTGARRMTSNSANQTSLGGMAAERELRLPPIGFWSYSRQDDELSRGKLSNLRALLMSEIQQQYGRDRVQLFQDVSAITHGAAWEREITSALNNSTFFIPIITPNFIQSEWCSTEVGIFLEREQRLFSEYPDLPRRSRIFPLQLIDITGIDAHDGQVLAALQKLQWFDFRHMRHGNFDDESIRRALSDFAASIRELLHVKVRPPSTKEDRERDAAEAAARAQEHESAAAERARQEDERRQREAEQAQARAEAERHAAAARAEAEQLAAAGRAERKRLARETGAAGWTKRAPLIRQVAFGAVPVVILLIGAVWLLSLRDDASRKADAERVRLNARPPTPAPVQGPAYQWLLGRWGIDGSCRSPRTISGEGSRITISWAGGRQVETIARAGARAVTTDVTTYRRDGATVTASERAIDYTYRMTPCPS